MAERPIWRGQLRLALVSCPIALHAAHRERANLHFHFINPATGNRVRMVTLDAETDEELERRSLLRGIEVEKGRFVTLDDEDFDKARIDSSATLSVSKFVPAEEINPVYFDSAYYVAPDGDTGQDVYVVLRDAIAATGQVALSRIVMSRRERAVCLMPMGKGLLLHTLHEQRDIADAEDAFARVPAGKPDAEMVKLARLLIDRQSETFHASDIEDRYEARLREVIDAKAKGQGFKAAAVEAEQSNVVDLMAALRRSLGQEPKTAPRTARAKPGKTTPRATTPRDATQAARRAAPASRKRA